MAAYLEQTHGASERRACRVLRMHRSTKRRQPGHADQGALVARLHALSERYPRFGYRKMFALLKGEQWSVSRETVRRLRQREGLQVVQKARKRRPLGTSTTTPTQAAYPNHVWSYDFVHDETTDGRRLTGRGRCRQRDGLPSYKPAAGAAVQTETPCPPILLPRP